MSRSGKVTAAVVVAGVVVGVAMFMLGRLTAPHAVEHKAAIPGVGDYFDGLRVGEAQGRQDGRALQEGSELPRGQRNVARHAFDAGYVAGMNDVFAGYDGGWTMRMPWIIFLEPGKGQIAYRIRARTSVDPGVEYYLCPDGHTLCHRRR
ncbi:MAG TPA: hypothetical protein VE442_15675 [Jatrophihabitans sp.]|jgi:hypothetical protein|nr:hypothetical protein [Jatrophihabitans sp.]